MGSDIGMNSVQNMEVRVDFPAQSAHRMQALPMSQESVGAQSQLQQPPAVLQNTIIKERMLCFSEENVNGSMMDEIENEEGGPNITNHFGMERVFSQEFKHSQ